MDGWRFENQQEIFCVVDGDNHDVSLGYNDDFYDDNNKFWMDSRVSSEIFERMDNWFRCSSADKPISNPISENYIKKIDF